MKLIVGAIITTGALASAIGSILGLRALIWTPPPPELGATISLGRLDRNVSLPEYEARNEPASRLAPVGRNSRRLAAYLSTLTTSTVTIPKTIPHGVTTTTGTTPTGTTPTGTTPTGTTPTGTTPTGTTPGTTTGHGLPPLLGQAASKSLNAGLHDALNEGPPPPHLVIEISTTNLGAECLDKFTSPDCALGSSSLEDLGVVSHDGSPRPLDVETFRDRLTKLLKSARGQWVDGKWVPVGVTVNYDVSLTGFHGKRVALRWAMYRPDGSPLPSYWLRNQLTKRLKAEAGKDSGSGSFWVPVPRKPGPYFVRVGLYDEDGDRLDYGDTDEFT